MDSVLTEEENKRPNASLRGQLLLTYSGSWGPEKSIFSTFSLRFTMLTGQQRQETRDVMRCGMISNFSSNHLGTNPHQPTQDLTDAARHLCHCGCESAAPFPLPLKYAYLGHQKNCGAEEKCCSMKPIIHMGLSENSVALNPMVNDHYPY